MDSLIEFSDIIEVDDETIDLYSIDNELFIKDHEGAVNLLNFLYLNSLSSDITITYADSTNSCFVFYIATGTHSFMLTTDAVDFSIAYCEGFRLCIDDLKPYLYKIVYNMSTFSNFVISFESSRFGKVNARCSQSNNLISIRFNGKSSLLINDSSRENVYCINQNILYLNQNKKVISYSVPIHIDFKYGLNYQGKFTYNGLSRLNDFFEPIKSVLKELNDYDFENLSIHELIKLNFNIGIDNEIMISVNISKYMNNWQGLNKRFLLLLKKHFYKMDSPDYNQFWLNITQYMESVLSISEGFSATISSTADIDQYLQLLDYNTI